MALKLVIIGSLIALAYAKDSMAGGSSEDSSSSGYTGKDLKKACADKGQQAMCCVIPVAGQGVLCQPASNGNSAACKPGLYSQAKCCATDVLGVADLNCDDPQSTSTGGGSTGGGSSGGSGGSDSGYTGSSLQQTCAAKGQQAKCCVIPVAGQAVLCQSASQGSSPACQPGLYSQPKCCATDVLGVADLNCDDPQATSTGGGSTGGGGSSGGSSGSNYTGKDLKKACADMGQQAACCVLPVLGQGVLCQPASNGNSPACQPGLYSQAKCCATDVLGVADLNCNDPKPASRK